MPSSRNIQSVDTPPRGRSMGSIRVKAVAVRRGGGPGGRRVLHISDPARCGWRTASWPVGDHSRPCEGEEDEL